MQKRNSNSRFLSLLILGVVFRGVLGFFSVQAADDPLSTIRAVQQSSATSTVSPTLTTTSLPTATVTGSPAPAQLSSLSSTTAVYAFVQAPVGHVPSPYVILTSFASISRTGAVSIRGYVNSQEFLCTDTPCAIDLDGSSRLVFRAFTVSGQSSEETIASVSVSSDTQGYLVNIDSVSQFTSFVDSCSIVWGMRDERNAVWDSFVQFPYQLNTQKTLHTLARNLILNGIVDTSSCEYGGLSIGLDWPTACGLEKVSGAMIEWQNQFDEYIWLASRDQGIPPKVLKSLIELESQFWPGNSRFYLDEFGLGQINQLGVDVLLRNDPSTYQKICPSVLTDCAVPYVSLEPSQQALIRGALVQSVNASCPACLYGLDIDKAKDSVSLIASLLRANCRQVDNILGIPYKPDEDVDAATATAVAATVAAGGSKPDADYEDYWRFTFLSYHSGISCFQTAVNETREAGLPVIWENLEKHLDCKGGGDYVNGLFDNLSTFDNYLSQAGDSKKVLLAPTIIPTRTPVATPTVYISTAVVKVQVYMDRNGNGLPDQNEWIDAMSVVLKTSGGDQVETRTDNGIVFFDMNGYRPGLGIEISLPGLYRSESFVLPEQGEIVITFKFDQPVLPTILP